MNHPALVVMAAGMGSRFGGPKQIAPVDEQGHILIDFSMYDAWRAGFRKVVFIIKREMEAEFRACIGDKLQNYFDVYYVYQELSRLPAGYSVPAGRVKPWGTGHAVACASEAVHEPFAVINADDYYGADAYQKIFDFLSAERPDTEHAMVGYLLRNTVTEFGSVARGVCEIQDGLLTGITERTHIEKRGDDAAYTEDGEHFVSLPGDTVVSMNLWGFSPKILDELRRRFPLFLDDALQHNPLKAEFYLPTVANAQIHEGLGTVRVLSTSATWHGVTYREDMPGLHAAIAQLRASGAYPDVLWK